MKNNLSFFLTSKVKLKITGKNADNFIRKLVNSKIELLNIRRIKKDIIYIWIYKKDYSSICRLKTVYDIEVVDAAGWIKIRKVISVNKFFIFSIILGFIILIILTNLIFDIEVIHNNKETRNFIKNELKKYGIEKYSIKKDYKKLNNIKEKILLEFNEKIEWIEIETVGIKYVVRVTLRETAEDLEKTDIRDVVAGKDATIKKIIAMDGQVVKTVNSYVKKGDTIISGTISLNDEIKGYVSAKGKVYGEVWYNITVEYPFTYYEERYTGEGKKAIVLNLLNYQFSLPINTKNNKYKIVKEKVLLKNNLLPLKISYQEQKEVEIIDQILTEEETIDAAIKLAYSQMSKELDNDEYIISQKNLKINIKNSKIVLDSFFVVYEDITDYKEIVKEKEETKVE